ncbi:tyrosine-type recombinase/integrase [Glycomyces harbinensis]|uniref:Site-specific recombinase XerD n=1 Tax=Glycomyces harbinensis TaxID=58114 RepID=A0A1G6V7F2_9ACTN|nr:site-specific integrase [Glycomyces harbinensis]SDD49323.1 Site-specific recombinase XerD [Glycomyces harbinensis]
MPAKKRRSFGKIFKLRSGRFQASYINPQGQREYAPDTFVKRRDAEVWLSRVEADISRGVWIGQEGANIVFADYAKEYLQRSSIGDRWREMCTINLKLHMTDLTSLTLAEISSLRVRQWHVKVSASKDHGKTVVAQSYRLLRAVMNQAVRDELIVKNPCNIPGAGSDKAPERQIATPQQVDKLLETILPRYRAPLLIAAWCSLRRGEIVNLRVADVDLEGSELHVTDAKSEAGVRTVAVPSNIMPYLVAAQEWSDGTWFFTSPHGGRMKANTFYAAFVRTRSELGLDHLTIHDLRHTGNTLAASVGATTKDLMRRLGHASDAAARRYLHTVEGRDAEIAKALAELATHGDATKLPKRLKGA